MIRGRPAAILFDMDGLLLDSERLIRDAMIAEMETHGLAMSHEQFALLVGRPETDSRALLASLYGPALAYDAIREGVRRRIVADWGHNRPLKPGAVQLLNQCRAAGLPCALVTSTIGTSARSHMQHSGLLAHFAVMIAGDDVKRGKPDPEPYRLAAARLNLEPATCLALEDSHNGVISAHAAGVPVIMVPDLLPATPEIRTRLLAVAPDLHVVANWLASAI